MGVQLVMTKKTLPLENQTKYESRRLEERNLLHFLSGKVSGGSLLFWRWVMGNRLKTPQQKAGIHCSDCPDYIERLDNVEKLNEFFGTEGQWDYATCYRACSKKILKENLTKKNHYHELAGV